MLTCASPPLVTVAHAPSVVSSSTRMMLRHTRSAVSRSTSLGVPSTRIARIRLNVVLMSRTILPQARTEFFRSGSACEKAAVVTLPQNPHPAAASSANGALLYQPRANRGPQGALLAPWGAKPWVQIEPPPSSANGALLYQPGAKPWVQIEPPPSSANGALLYQPRAKPWVQIEPPPKG